jgi:hypothetical protein
MIQLAIWTILTVYSKVNYSISIWSRQNPIICCRDPTCQDIHISSLLYHPCQAGCIPSIWTHHPGLEPPVQPCHYHINRYTGYLYWKSFKLKLENFTLFYNIMDTLGSIKCAMMHSILLCLSPGDFTCQGGTGDRAGTQWLEILWKSRGGGD